jgi:hypothetical protein
MENGKNSQNAASPDMMWAYLAHFGFNSWYNWPLSQAPKDAAESFTTRCLADHVRMDEELWRELSVKLPQNGVNTIVIDLAEILKYPRRPELAVKGSWEPEKMQNEIRRLRTLGLDVVPKLNFSAAHDSWLKEYDRMLSTQIYYEVCADLIKDVVEIFTVDGRPPRYFHLGYDEETHEHQSADRYIMSIVRRGELWWHDFLWFVRQVEAAGVRAWIWSDKIWHDRETFVKRMPKTVLQSNWYYWYEFDPQKGRNIYPMVHAYDWLEEAGFEQVPTGSCLPSAPENMRQTVEYCKPLIAPSRLKGFMIASWARTWRLHQNRLEEAMGKLSASRSLFEGRGA